MGVVNDPVGDWSYEKHTPAPHEAADRELRQGTRATVEVTGRFGTTQLI
jgi:hypothetical protein